MLIVHPSSTCDVCLDPYTWATAANTPHAIACGHVFCLQCLMSTHPSLCPLCRKTFSPERIKKLHIDRYVPNDSIEPDETPQINDFLQRIALVSGEDMQEDSVADVLSEVSRWLATRSEGQGLYRVLRMSVDALNRSIERAAENQSMRDAIEQREAEWERSYRRQEQDVRTSRLVEKNLLEQLEEYKSKLTRAERSLDTNQSEMHRLYSEHAQLRAQVAGYQTNGTGLTSARQSSRASTGRPTTSMSRRTHLSAVTSGTMASAANGTMTRAISEPLTGVPCMIEEEEPAQLDHSTAKKPSRPPVLMPGAYIPRKVVPSAPDSYIMVHPDRRTPTFGGIQDPFSSSDDNDSSDGDEVRSDRRVIPTISAPPYGYLPGVGYVPMVPSSPPSINSADDTAGHLVLYDPGQVSDHDQSFVDRAEASGSDNQPEDIIPVAPWDSSSDDIAMQANISSTSVDVPSVVFPASYGHHTPSSSSLSSLSFLAIPPSASQPVANSTPRREAYSPEPSIASWGTVPSTRTSRGPSITDLQLTGLPAPAADLDLPSQPPSLSSSFGDLRLTGLPSISTRNNSLHEVARSDNGHDTATRHTVAWEENVVPPRPDDGPYSISASHGRRREASTSRDHEDLNEVVTPRARRTPTEPISLGLSISSSSSSSWHRPTGALDQSDVNPSFARAHSDSRATPRHRHVRVVSGPAIAGSPRPSSRARTSHNGSTDSVEIAVLPSAHGHNGSHTSRDVSFTSTSRRNSYAVPHTDRISGPHQLPNVVQRNESHGDYNRQRRHSSLSLSYLAAGQREGEIPDRHAEVTRTPILNGVGHAHIGPRTQPVNSRPASIYSMRGPSFSTPSSDSLSSAGCLGLSLAPPIGPSSSAATTSSGEPSTIRAPRPVNGSHSSNIFSMWGPRGGR